MKQLNEVSVCTIRLQAFRYFYNNIVFPLLVVSFPMLAFHSFGLSIAAAVVVVFVTTAATAV